MANRLIGNVIIIDSAMGNAFILNSANQPMQLTNIHANAVVFWSSDTTGRLIISAIDTTNHLASFSWLSMGSNGSAFITIPATQSTQFGQKQNLSELKVPVLTAGTAWIYLC